MGSYELSSRPAHTHTGVGELEDAEGVDLPVAGEEDPEVPLGDLQGEVAGGPRGGGGDEDGTGGVGNG